MRKQVISSQHWLHVLLRDKTTPQWGKRGIINICRRIGHGNYVCTWTGKVRYRTTFIHHWGALTSYRKLILMEAGRGWRLIYF